MFFIVKQKYVLLNIKDWYHNWFVNKQYIKLMIRMNHQIVNNQSTGPSPLFTTYFQFYFRHVIIFYELENKLQIVILFMSIQRLVICTITFINLLPDLYQMIY